MWGHHLTMDCKACKIDKVTSEENIKNFAKELVERINMTAYGEPLIVHFGSEHTTGYTLVQLIETSNISGHFCDDTGDCYLDVFSCKSFELDKVYKTVDKYFEPTSKKVNYFIRDANF